MIGRLRGVVAELEADEILIDVAGVGYLVRCGSRTLSRAPGIGQELVLHIETQFTQEGGARLFGFLSREDRAIFRLLQSIQGVGPKAALSVLDVLSPAELANAVARDDRAAVGRANGVGPKLALRILTELKGKPIGGGLGPEASTAPASLPSLGSDATSALIGLGISEPLARRAVEQGLAQKGDGVDLPTLIKTALQEVGR